MTKERRRSIVDYLKKLGFSTEYARVYVALVGGGPMSLLELSRVSGIERTRLYRMVPDMTKQGLVEEVLGHKTTIVKASDLLTLRRMVDEKVLQAQALGAGFELFSEQVSDLVGEVVPIQVVYFRGREGIDQMNWNVLSAKGVIRSYVCRVFQEMTGQWGLERWAEEFVREGKRMLELQDPEFSVPLDGKPFSKVDLGERYERRVIPRDVFTIAHNMDIYDNVVAIYQWRDEEMFGVEIRSDAVAQMQRAMHEVFWEVVASR